MGHNGIPSRCRPAAGAVPQQLRLRHRVLPGGEQFPLFRLRYDGSAHSFGFAIYSAARERYEDAVLLTGLWTGSPQEALDTACTVHLAGIGHEPTPEPGELTGLPLP